MTILSPAQKRGFNLVEAAIVLGVIGLVIGGIWVAASAINEKRQTTENATTVLTMIQGIRNIMKGQPYPDNSVWLHEMVINANILPSNWSYNDGLTIRSPWGVSVNISIAYDLTELAASTGHGLYFNFDTLSNSQCINLVTSITSRFKDQSNLVFVAIGSATYLRSFPADFATITTNCLNRGGNQAVMFAFSP